MAQTWFITGASSGFGRAIAEYVVTQGDNVVGIARRTESLQDLVAQAPDRVVAIAADVTEVEDVENAVQAVADRFSRIDVLVNNAGFGMVGAVEETSDASLRRVMETNFFAAMTVTRTALPLMRRQRTGAIVMMSSMGGQMSFAGFGAYSASKFALEGASEALAQEIAPFGLKLMIVEPGAFRTNFAAPGTMVHLPETEAYQSIVGPTRRFAYSMHGAQNGDPAKAARAIATAIAADTPPLRLALGSDAIDCVRDHASDVLAEMSHWARVGRDVSLEIPNEQETAA
ncbi:oxidoreductase [Litoreibacter roseus]|uniref:Short-chain dehydrogenase/reductase n=1 Tax=Litoreibacter roseus TaxID=2601869 RepID=A0A6N6JLC8_9RHOB|nr:oxidoreductase [Litoreibacter roseus]GFE66767.1 short-chain dehydrogenase/reductase [Litoreibacter roseus]